MTRLEGELLCLGVCLFVCLFGLYDDQGWRISFNLSTALQNFDCLRIYSVNFILRDLKLSTF